MKINEMLKQQIEQQVEPGATYQYAVYDIEPVNEEPNKKEYDENEGYDTLTTHFSACRFEGYILPLETNLKPAKYTAYWREIAEQVYNEGTSEEKIKWENKRFSCPVKMFNYLCYKLRQLDSITIEGKKCKVFTIETTEYEGQIKVK